MVTIEKLFGHSLSFYIKIKTTKNNYIHTRTK